MSASLLTIVAGPVRAVQIPHSQVVSATPVAWTPNILDGKVNAIAQIGNRMFAAGTFSQAQNATGGTTYSRSRILAFDATTGVIDPSFAPTVDAEITAMVAAPGGGAIIIAGAFTTVNGATVQRLAKLNSTTGSLVAGFSAKVTGRINDMALWGNSVVIGGQFPKVNGVARPVLAAVDTTTGALDGRIQDLTIDGQFNGGTTNIKELDVTTDGTKLIMIGNFTSVAGQPRVQIAMVDLTSNPATLSSWATNGFTGACAGVFESYMRSVQFSPDGTYFVVGDTGAGYFPTTYCDTVTRWETSATGGGQQPTWIDYSGGDTITEVAVTGAAVYAGGHMRWMNNDAVGDVAAGGAVSREGLTALDPQNGMPLEWNPTRARGVGVFTFLATPTGLWIGHDTKTVANQTHNRIAFFPIAGGSSVPVGQNATLPATLYNTARAICPRADTSVLYRVNTGGPAISSNDCGPAWLGDETNPSPYRNNGSNIAGPYSLGAGVTGNVPTGTPRTIFDTERWSPSDNPAMLWAFPIPAGRHIQVRLYFSNGYDGTSQPGQRVFNVKLDGTTVLANYDIVADVGNKVGTMKAFNVTSDGTVNIDFAHVVENPLVNGIEIVDLDAPPLPVEQYCAATDLSILYRVDAGGPTLGAFDCGPGWSADQSDPSPYRNGGSNTGSWDPVVAINGSVPASTPPALFQTERWSPSDNPALQWAFPVAAGKNVEVRLYFANGYPGTGSPGQRRFNVTLDGNTVLAGYDIAADVGDRTGVMKSFNITSDGTVNIDFSHVVENPLVNGIEIIDRDAPPGPQPMASASFLGRRSFDGTNLGPNSTLNTPGTDWSQSNGAFSLNGKVYAAWSDGDLYSWTFNGSTFGPRVDVLEQGNYVYGRTWTSFANVTGMFWQDGRMYYTRDGDAHLFYRYFTPASELVGSVQRVASGPGVDSLDWSAVQGMTEASDKIYYATPDGNLNAISFVNRAPVPGTQVVLSGPTVDGRDWRTSTMFNLPQGTADTTAPTVPGKPSGTSVSTSSIDLTWAASSDAVSSTLTYRIYRDGGAVAVGQVDSSSAGVVTFTDTGLSAGSSHTYRVDATDAANNTSAKSTASDPITVQSGNTPIFSDTFGSGSFAAWTSNTRMTIDGSQGGNASPSARMNTTNQSAYAYKDLSSTLSSICVSANVNVTSLGGTTLDVLRLRAPNNDPFAKAFIHSSGKLAIRDDYTGVQNISSVLMPSGWHNLELCSVAGTNKPTTLYLDGIKVIDGWLIDTDPAGIARVQIGDTANKTIVANWDDVVVDQLPG